MGNLLLQDKPKVIVFCNGRSLNTKEIFFIQILMFYRSVATNPYILSIPSISNP